MDRHYPNAHKFEIVDFEGLNEYAGFIRMNCRRGDYSSKYEYERRKMHEGKWWWFIEFKFANDTDAIIFKLRFIG
jgi:hypothetical protein